ncbi:AT-hook motif nuclear-localized protein 14-like isoform X2 [Phoenix dactylifera]|uniref:AT-hook motif nuclear-localized protein n=1 Tax=Phoenix dactylifera TaxID=42345 RepID=A0A8B9AMU0_PHODC|nr:AT-hook motif nuclear-localized protein 14-like isoform X2 [Phoenix dactylifera]
MDEVDGALPPYYPHGGGSSFARKVMFSSASPSSASECGPVVFPHLVGGRAPAASAPSPAEPVRRKRGRPRKYGASPFPSPPSLVSSVKKPSVQLPSSRSSSSSRKKEASSSSSKKAQLAALGNVGQGFTPHVLTIASGEKIMSFVQQHRRAFCILSASGSISSASLIQPAMYGGCITYEGRFEILSLSGSFLHTETGGASSRTGGLSICLSGADGRVIGGGVGGPLLATGPVQVIACSFLIDTDREISSAKTVENSASIPSITTQAGTTVTTINFKSTEESNLRTTTSRGSDDHQTIGASASSYMLKSRAMHMVPPFSSMEWRGRQDGVHGACQSPDDDNENIQD